MGPGETIGLIAVVLLAIALTAATFATYSRHILFKQRKLELEADRDARGSGGAESRIAQLEQRVRVLERIATDRGQLASAELSAQIEDLRAERATTGELQ